MDVTTPVSGNFMVGMQYGDILHITSGWDQKWWNHGLYEITDTATATKMTFWRGWYGRMKIWWRNF